LGKYVIREWDPVILSLFNDISLNYARSHDFYSKIDQEYLSTANLLILYVNTTHCLQVEGWEPR